MVRITIADILSTEKKATRLFCFILCDMDDINRGMLTFLILCSLQSTQRADYTPVKWLWSVDCVGLGEAKLVTIRVLLAWQEKLVETRG